MKTCPKCNTIGIPDEAKFCPNCGTMLQKEDPVKKMTISECRFAPSIIKKGEPCRLLWKGENVSSIRVDDKPYQIYEDIILRPNQSHTYNIAFVDNRGDVNGKVIREQLNVTVKSPYLFDGKGQPSEIKGKLIVDIRQCKRTNGLGWNGKYEFQGETPVGYDGFYAMFDESQSIQILVEKGELNTIFLVWRDYTFKFWRGEKREAYKKDIGIIFSDYVTQYRYKKVIFGAMYYNGELLHSVKNHEVGKENIGLLIDRLTDTYHKEVYNFFGISIEQLLENVEDYAEYEEEYDKD